MDTTVKKVLIVEDEQQLAKALKFKFANSGLEATAVYNGEEAIALIEKEKFDVILLDLMMPKVDGFGVLKKIKELGIRTPVIVASNLGQEHDINEAKKLGAKDYVIKSNTPIAEIVEKVQKVIG